jgi:hypothetical protein
MLKSWYENSAEGMHIATIYLPGEVGFPLLCSENSRGYPSFGANGILEKSVS